MFFCMFFVVLLCTQSVHLLINFVVSGNVVILYKYICVLNRYMSVLNK